jgi:hypothetical protein
MNSSVVMLSHVLGMSGGVFATRSDFQLPVFEIEALRPKMFHHVGNSLFAFSRWQMLGYAKDEISVSGFRALPRLCSTRWGGRWKPDAIEHQLAHMKESDVRRA